MGRTCVSGWRTRVIQNFWGGGDVLGKQPLGIPKKR
jgi:hypothetical protein